MKLVEKRGYAGSDQLVQCRGIRLVAEFEGDSIRLAELLGMVATYLPNYFLDALIYPFQRRWGKFLSGFSYLCKAMENNPSWGSPDRGRRDGDYLPDFGFGVFSSGKLFTRGHGDEFYGCSPLLENEETVLTKDILYKSEDGEAVDGIEYEY
jgi:hypothetical protein